jgi:hypothetical protein
MQKYISQFSVGEFVVNVLIWLTVRKMKQKCYFCSSMILQVLAGETDCTEFNWKMRINFEHQLPIPKQEQMSVSVCVQKHLICELQLKEYIYNNCSKCPPFSAYLDTSHHGPLHPRKDGGVVADSLTGIHNAMLTCLFVVNRNCKGFLGVPTGKNLEDSNLASVEVMQWGLLCLSIGHDSCYWEISHSTAKICRSTIMYILHLCSDCQWYIFQ